MRYYPKNAVGVELSSVRGLMEDHVVPVLLEDFRSEGEDEEFIESYVHPLIEALDEWSGEIYDDVVFDAIYEEFGVEPMRMGNLPDERGGEISGVTGFDTDTEYVFFDKREQDDDSWQAFLDTLEEHNIPLVEGSWSQLG